MKQQFRIKEYMGVYYPQVLEHGTWCSIGEDGKIVVVFYNGKPSNSDAIFHRLCDAQAFIESVKIGEIIHKVT